MPWDYSYVKTRCGYLFLSLFSPLFFFSDAVAGRGMLVEASSAK